MSAVEIDARNHTLHGPPMTLGNTRHLRLTCGILTQGD
jgi:hypothetical protein